MSVPLTQALGPQYRFVVLVLTEPFETHRVGTSTLPGKTDYARVSGYVADPLPVPVIAPLPPRPTSIT